MIPNTYRACSLGLTLFSSYYYFFSKPSKFFVRVYGVPAPILGPTLRVHYLALLVFRKLEPPHKARPISDIKEIKVRAAVATLTFFVVRGLSIPLSFTKLAQVVLIKAAMSECFRLAFEGFKRVIKKLS